MEKRYSKLVVDKSVLKREETISPGGRGGGGVTETNPVVNKEKGGGFRNQGDWVVDGGLGLKTYRGVLGTKVKKTRKSEEMWARKLNKGRTFERIKSWNNH